MCAIDDCQPWDVYRDSTPVARTEHHCTECGRTIRVGETYHFATGLMDGDWSRYKTCRHCTGLGEFMYAMCGGYPFGWLHHELVEHWSEGYASIPLGRLIVAMKRGWNGGADPVPAGCGDMARELMQKAVA